MAYVFKCTMFFDGRTHGWSESWWLNQASLDYDGAMSNLMSLAKVRSKLLGKECSIKGLRVSMQDVRGDSYLEYVTYKGNYQEPAAEPDAAILFSVRDETRKRFKHTFLRGFWDSVETNNGEYLKNVPAWKALMDDYKAFFEGQFVQWGWWGVDVPLVAAVVGYTSDLNNRLTFNFGAPIFPAATFGTHQRVRLTGVNGRSNLNGVHVVVPLNAQTAITYLPISSVPYQFGGKATFSTYKFFDANHAGDQRITTRKVGAFFLESVGHASRRPRT